MNITHIACILLVCNEFNILNIDQCMNLFIVYVVAKVVSDHLL
jgi:hypothetical protein